MTLGHQRSALALGLASVAVLGVILVAAGVPAFLCDNVEAASDYCTDGSEPVECELFHEDSMTETHSDAEDDHCVYLGDSDTCWIDLEVH